VARARYALPLTLVLAAFAIDVCTPNGVVDGFLYVAAVLSCFWVPSANAAPYTAMGLMLPMALGFALTPAGAPMQVAIGNRCIALGTIWLAAYTVHRSACIARNRESMLVGLSEKLKAARQAVQTERIILSDWLHEEMNPELDMIAWRLKCLPHRRHQQGFDFRGEAVMLQRAIRRASQAAREQEDRLRRAAAPAFRPYMAKPRDLSRERDDRPVGVQAGLE
jgi:hypothetical protein